MKKQLKPLVAALIIVLTIGVFAFYIKSHPQVTHKLGEVKLTTLIALLLAYTITFLALAWVLRISLLMYGKRLTYNENLLLNAYSSLINFFGPGQSGPAIRGVYLHRKHGFKLKSYIFTTLLYYAYYAVFSAFLLCVGSQPWWQTAVLVIVVTACSLFVIKWYSRKSQLANEPGITPKTLGLLGVATALQLAAQTAIYYIELTSVAGHIAFAHALSYTGAANFALFVSVTPGAIGIREAFLVFSQHLHHISNNTIVTANIIDRGVYLLFLGLLAVIVISFHAKERFGVKS